MVKNIHISSYNSCKFLGCHHEGQDDEEGLHDDQLPAPREDPQLLQIHYLKPGRFRPTSIQQKQHKYDRKKS